jgi:hypothetical protein
MEVPMKTRIVHLHIKILSLAAEAGIIRSEERVSIGLPRSRDLREGEERGRIDSVLHDSLVVHRRNIVRVAARHALLAYGFLRGLDYAKMEPKSLGSPNFAEVSKLVDRFGACYDPSSESYSEYLERKKTEKAQLEAWISSAKPKKKQESSAA